MGQIDLCRTEFEARVVVTAPANDDKQIVNFTGYFKVGDVVDVVDVDADGNITSVISDNRQVMSIDPDVSLILDAVVDTTAATGTPMIICQNIDDGQEAIDRLYKRKITGTVDFNVQQAILAQDLSYPSVGKTTFYVEDVRFVRAGDTADIIADEGIISTSKVVDSVTPNADDTNNRAAIAFIGNIDTSGFTNPRIVFTDISVQDAIERNQERIDEIDRPVENEYLGVGNGAQMSWFTANLFRVGTTKLLLDGVRKRLGTTGTLATLSNGAGNAQLLFRSVILGDNGNRTKVAVVAGAGIVVTVTGNFTLGFTVSVTNSGGTATAKQIADAINASAAANIIVQARYGLDGSGVVTPFAASSFTGGLDDGVGDYAEMEQVYRNQIVNTGYKIVSFHVRPNEPNRLSKPIRQSEELVVDYRRPSENVNR